jgi:protein-L-isoaspartate(D-aspartate) O-methyltransferase
MIRYESDRFQMVEDQILRRGVKDEHVLEAMRKIPRHLFVPEKLRDRAYCDEPLPIGEEQTISQPYIVAYMTEVLNLSGKEEVLEVGTGSGYQTAVLAESARQVFTVDLMESLSRKARTVLADLGYSNIHFRVGDGSRGWAEASPFEAIMVTAAPAVIPKALTEQLAVGGRMIIPVGEFHQDLILVTKQKRGLKKSVLIPVRFVPLLPVH